MYKVEYNSHFLGIYQDLLSIIKVSILNIQLGNYIIAIITKTNKLPDID